MCRGEVRFRRWLQGRTLQGLVTDWIQESGGVASECSEAGREAYLMERKGGASRFEMHPVVMLSKHLALEAGT